MDRDELQKTFSTNLHARRTELDIKQNVISTETHISISNYSKYENGNLLPRLETAVILAEYLGVSLDELCGNRQTISNYLQVIEAFEELEKAINITFAPVEMSERGQAEELHIVIKDSSLATYYLKEQQLRKTLASGAIAKEDYDILIGEHRKRQHALRTKSTVYESSNSLNDYWGYPNHKEEQNG